VNDTPAPLVQDDATRLRRRVYRAETVMVLVAVLAFVGMWGVRKWTLSQLGAVMAPQCAPEGQCRDTYVHSFYNDVACPRADQRIETVTGESGFFCRCERSK
jgi:hypothetical protein